MRLTLYNLPRHFASKISLLHLALLPKKPIFFPASFLCWDETKKQLLQTTFIVVEEDEKEKQGATVSVADAKDTSADAGVIKNGLHFHIEKSIK